MLHYQMGGPLLMRSWPYHVPKRKITVDTYFTFRPVFHQAEQWNFKCFPSPSLETRSENHRGITRLTMIDAYPQLISDRMHHDRPDLGFDTLRLLTVIIVVVPLSEPEFRSSIVHFLSVKGGKFSFCKSPIVQLSGPGAAGPGSSYCSQY